MANAALAIVVGEDQQAPIPLGDGRERLGGVGVERGQAGEQEQGFVNARQCLRRFDIE